MKRFLLKTASIGLPILLLIMGINFVVDPAELFGGNVSVAAKWMANGSHVAGLANYDERILQQKWIEASTLSPQAIVLGSSRAMLINRVNSGIATLCNHSVSGARFEDLLAIYQLYQNNGVTPRSVVIEISPYMFGALHNDKRYTSIQTHYQKMASTLNLAADAPWSAGRWAELVSFSYFQSSIDAIGRPKADIFATDSDSAIADTYIKRCDGAVVYPLDFQRKGVVASELNAALNYGNISAATTIDGDRLQMFEAFVNYLKKRCAVSIFLAPIPAVIYDKRPIYGLVERYVNTLGVPVVGSYCGVNVDNGNFYDWMHPSQRIVDSMLIDSDFDAVVMPL